MEQKAKEYIPKKCKNPECSNSAYSSLIPYCGHVCKNKMKSPDLKLKSIYKPISKVSKKRQVENAKYSVLRIEFLGKKENHICQITGFPATEVHHKWCGKDRAKYYLDTTTWMAVSRDGHNWIHDNPKESRELGYLK